MGTVKRSMIWQKRLGGEERDIQIEHRDFRTLTVLYDADCIFAY